MSRNRLIALLVGIWIISVPVVAQYLAASTSARPLRAASELRKAVDRAARQAANAELAGNYEQHAAALTELGSIQLEQGDTENAVRSTLRSIAVAQTTSPAVHRKAVLQLAGIHLAAGHPERCLERLNEIGTIPAGEKAERAQFIRLQAIGKSRSASPEELIAHLNKVLGEVERSQNNELLAELYALAAAAHTRSSGFQQAIALEDKVFGLALANGNATQAGISANNLAQLLRGTPRQGEVRELYERALILLDDEPNLRTNTMVNYALDRAFDHDHSGAAKIMNEAEQLASRIDGASCLPMVLRTKATLQLSSGEMEKAAISAGKALRMAMDLNDELEQARCHDLLSNISERQGGMAVARQHHKQAAEHRKKAQAEHESLLRQQAADLAHWQRMEREQLETVNDRQRHRSELRQMMSDSENQEKRLALLFAEKKLEEGRHREENLMRVRIQQDLALTQAALEAERSDHMIKDLENTRLLQALSMDRLSMERKQRDRDLEHLQQQKDVSEARSRVLEAERTHQRTLQFGSIVVALLMLVFGGYMTWAWYTARQKKRTISVQKRQIEGINAQLAEKNQDIESSLRYAQTIQSAILPTESAFREIVPESFLLYKPLDKVSGDLPFLLRIGRSLYLAAIDCTGHGVPAGMMTFIAYYGLKDLIKQHPSASCGELLDRLHLHVKQSMDSRDGGGLYNDGMDIGLCRLDLDTGEMVFSGAQLSLIIVRQGKTTRLKGDLLPLGDDQFERANGYRDHHLKLEPSDRIFLFSDGLIHQFGGENGRKKFSMRRLSEILETNASEGLDQVKAATESHLENWKGSTPQTDDILMIGLSYAA